MRITILLASLAVLLACEGTETTTDGSAATATYDGGVATPDAGPMPPPEPAELRLAHEGVGQWGPVVLETTQPLGSLEVTLVSDYGDVIEVEVRDDGEGRVVLVPDGWLAEGVTHTLEASGVDLEGNEVRFEGRVRALTAYETDVRFYDETGALRSTTTFTREYDDEGRILERRSYGPGPDDVPGTADDVVRRVTSHRHDDGVVLVSTYFPGPDGRFPTSDDLLRDYHRDHLDEHGLVRATEHFGPGPDGVMGTPDDELLYWQALVRDGRGRVRRSRDHRDAGPDGVWMTGDDPIFAVTEIEDDGLETYRFVWHTGPGPDGVWDTDDDRIFQGSMVTRVLERGARLTYYDRLADEDLPETGRGRFLTVLDDLGRPAERFRFLSSGPDGEPGTPDDEYSAREELLYRDDGTLASVTEYRVAAGDRRVDPLNEHRTWVRSYSAD